MEPLILIAGILGILLVVGISIYPAFKVMPYAYVCSRVRALRRKMVSRSELESFAGESYKDVLYNLEKKGFEYLLDLIDHDFREEAVQRTIRRKYSEELRKITRSLPKKHRKFFEILQMKEDFEFILAVIRSKINPNYDRHILKELVVESDLLSKNDLENIGELSLEDFFSKIRQIKGYQIISDHLDMIREGDLISFEKELNKDYFKRLNEATAGNESMKKFVKMLIDIHNIRHSLSFNGNSFIKGGSLGQNILQQLKEAKDIKEIIKILESTDFKDCLAIEKNGENDLADKHSINEIVKGLFKRQKKFADKLLVREPLSIEQILSYFIHKRIEMKNIRILLKLIHAKFEPEEIRGALV